MTRRGGAKNAIRRKGPPSCAPAIPLGDVTNTKPREKQPRQELDFFEALDREYRCCPAKSPSRVLCLTESELGVNPSRLSTREDVGTSKRRQAAPAKRVAPAPAATSASDASARATAVLPTASRDPLQEVARLRRERDQARRERDKAWIQRDRVVRENHDYILKMEAATREVDRLRKELEKARMAGC